MRHRSPRRSCRQRGVRAVAPYPHRSRLCPRVALPPSVDQGNTLTVAISQSGETADTLAAAGLAKSLDSRLLALTNVVGSTLSREGGRHPLHPGRSEIAVASTKAYLTMLLGEYLLALAIGQERGVIPADVDENSSRVCGLPPRSAMPSRESRT